MQSSEEPVPENTILIMGGKYKGGDLSRLNDLMQQKIKRLILIGEAAELMNEAYRDIVNVSMSDTLENAVLDAFEHASENDTVLLSPACSSFDMFNDFEHRGRVFKEAVMKLKERG